VIRVGNELVLRVRVLGRSKVEGGRVGVLRTSERQVADLEPTSYSGDPQGSTSLQWKHLTGRSAAGQSAV
jgi:hypothetical protein